MSNFLIKTLNNRLNKEELLYYYDESNDSINIFHKDNIYTMCVADYPFKPPKNLKVNNQFLIGKQATAQILILTVKGRGA